MSVEILEVKQEHMSLDLLLWRRFTTETAGLVESTLAANAALADFGPILPVGTRVLVELDDATPAPTIVKVVRLWD